MAASLLEPMRIMQQAMRPGLAGGARLVMTLKLLTLLADYSIVQRSALVAGLSLALCGLALIGISDWVGGGFDNSPGAGSATSSSGYDYSGAAAAPRVPALPEGGYLPVSAPGYTFHRNVPEVRLQFTVADEQGRAVLNLSPDEVRVFDNQLAVPHFSDFERDDNLPLRLGLVLDTSDSVKRVLPDEKAASVNFLQRVMRPQSDSAFVMAFGGDVKLWQASTADRQQLIEAIARVKQPGWGTRFFDALYSACSPALAGDEGKLVHRAIVVLSDGDDTQSFRGLADVIAIAQRSEIQIYALTIHAKQSVGRGDRILQRLADATGGRLYVAESSRDLDGAFAQIEQELRAQYYVSFTPQGSAPGFHSLRVEARASRKLEIHARKGYYATEQ